LEIYITAFLAFYVAWNLGANDVANSMGTSVGSKALTIKQAIIVAGILEFIGAVIFSKNVSSKIATDVTDISVFSDRPEILLLGMTGVLISCGLWLQIATNFGLPVASSHAVIGAIAGFSLVAAGQNAVNWEHILEISLAWIVTPLISGAIAAIFYGLLKHWILDPPSGSELGSARSDTTIRLGEWIPWLSAILVSIFGVIVLPSLFDRPVFDFISLPHRDLALAFGGIAAISLTVDGWNQLERLKEVSKDKTNQKLQIERVLARFQVVSACFVAFGHGANDVGNAIAPLAIVVYVFNNNSIPFNGLNIPIWILILGGLGIVFGLSFQGKNVITTVGEGIIHLQPSSGFCAEIATATTILIASRFGFPVSTSHALVGAVVGIGIFQGWQNVSFATIKSVILAWVVTLPFTAVLSAIAWLILRSLFLN